MTDFKRYEKVVNAIAQDEDFKRLTFEAWDEFPPGVEVPTGPDDLGYHPSMMKAIHRGRDIAMAIDPSIFSDDAMVYGNIFVEARKRLEHSYLSKHS